MHTNEIRSKTTSMRRATIRSTNTLRLNFSRFSSYFITIISFSTPISRFSFKRFISYTLNPDLPSPCEDPQWAFANFLKSSSKSTITLLELKSLHCRATKTGLVLDGQLGIGLLNLYVKCSSLDLAHKLFDEMADRDALLWTILISGYSRVGKYEMGLHLFTQMIIEGDFPNCFTLATILKCCVYLRDMKRGKRVHGWIVRNGVEMDVVLANTMIDFYAKCGAFFYAKKVFEMMGRTDTISWNIMISSHLEIGDIDGSMKLFRASPTRDVSSWNTIINGQMHNGLDSMALHLLCEMVDSKVQFNQFTFSMALTLAGKLVLLELGRQIHAQTFRFGYESDAFIRNSLIDMYSKCGKAESSLIIFNISPLASDGSTAKTIQWCSMITGFVLNGRGGEAIMLFAKMLREGIKVDKFTLTSISSACSDGGILEQGRQIHACIEKLGHGHDVFIASSVTDMYAKCGSLEDARNVFDATCSKSVVLWTSMISSYASHGHGTEAIQLFEKMLEEKVVPNEITFLGVLSACSHGGLIREGYKYFKSMREDYKIAPRIEHFTCMVDLLGRSGQINEAKGFIVENKIGHHCVVWKALLSTCRFHNNVEMTVWASEQLLSLKSDDIGCYILLSNIYATGGRFFEANKLRNLMRDREMSKEPGQSWILLNNQVHVFVVGDRSHPDAEAIYSCLEQLAERLKELGLSQL